jgi:tripartite-type tricarboxylate transporter receptor subunit TctC
METAMKTLLSTLFVAAALAGSAATAWAADAYPSKPVRVIVPVTAGGGVDTLARLLAQHLRTELGGEPFIVENKPGAGGNIGLDLLAKSAPDGYTLAVVPNTMTINQTLMARLPFDTVKSFAPIGQIATSTSIIGSRAGLPPKTLQELVAYAKSRPGTLTFGGCDTGSILHLSGEMFKQQAGVDITHVPYKGCADSIPNVLGGQVDLIFITLSNVANYLPQGRIQAYAVASSKRSRFAPDIPTAAEQGYPGVAVDIWYGMLAPAGTPADIIAKLNKALNAVLAKPEVQASMATAYMEPAGGTAEQFGSLIKTDIDRYGAVIKKAGIKID